MLNESMLNSDGEKYFCADMYLIQANHVAETSVFSGDQLLRHKVILPGGFLDTDLLPGLREVSHEPQDDPPHCQRSLVKK